ncbi:hypothetical protein SC409_05060 [Legionella pneumophila serogroup 1]
MVFSATSVFSTDCLCQAGSEIFCCPAIILFLRINTLAFLVSIEEIARELPAALKGRAEISFGNVVGSIFAFFLFNAGIIAMIKPVKVNQQTLIFYLPFCLFTMVIISLFMLTQRISRWMGGVLVFLYLIFAVGGYFLF